MSKKTKSITYHHRFNIYYFIINKYTIKINKTKITDENDKNKHS